MSTTDFLNVRQTAKALGVHEDIDRMREEMWSQFAPATEAPEMRRPSKRQALSDEDYNG
jgi:hypothetical protein